MLLECFSRDIERKIIGVNNTLDKAEMAGHHVLEVISAENPPDVQLDVLSCMSVLVELFRRLAVGNEEEGPEGHLSLGDKVCLGHGAALVLGDELIELVVLPLLDLIRLPGFFSSFLSGSSSATLSSSSPTGPSTVLVLDPHD